MGWRIGVVLLVVGVFGGLGCGKAAAVGDVAEVDVLADALADADVAIADAEVELPFVFDVPAEAQPVASAVVGPEGGTLEGEGVALAIPAGALAAKKKVSVWVSTTPAPDGYGLGTPVYEFRPEGLAFAVPAELVLQVTMPQGAEAVLYWSTADGAGFEPVGLAAAGEVRGSTLHFSKAFGGVDCHADTEPAPPCPDCEPTALPGNCTCESKDLENGGALCQKAPDPESTSCDPGDAVFIGVEGDGCYGAGLTPIMRTRCVCSGNGTGKQLCHVPPDPPFDQACPPSGDFQTHFGEAGQSCFGYYVGTDVNNQKYPQGESGTLGSCVTEKIGSEWRYATGVLEGCYGGYDQEPEIPPAPKVPKVCSDFGYGEEP
jgi:hypothetical protein